MYFNLVDKINRDPDFCIKFQASTQFPMQSSLHQYPSRVPAARFLSISQGLRFIPGKRNAFPRNPLFEKYKHEARRRSLYLLPFKTGSSLPTLLFYFCNAISAKFVSCFTHCVAKTRFLPFLVFLARASIGNSTAFRNRRAFHAIKKIERRGNAGIAVKSYCEREW